MSHKATLQDQTTVTGSVFCNLYEEKNTAVKCGEVSVIVSVSLSVVLSVSLRCCHIPLLTSNWRREGYNFPILCVTPVLSHQVCSSWGSSCVHCVQNSLWGTAFNKLNSGCSSQHLLNLHFPIVVADSAVEVCNRAIDKMPHMFLVLQKEVKHTELTVNLTTQFPKIKYKNKNEAMMEAVNERTYLVPN